MRHYSFKELEEYIYDDKLNMQKMIDINSHIYKCADCKEIYNAIMDIRDAVDNLNRAKYIFNSKKMVQSVANEKSDLQVIKELVNKAKNTILLNIPSLYCIEAIANDSLFKHPYYALSYKSTATIVPTEEKMMNQVIDSKSSQRISIDEDGSLNVYMPYDNGLVNKKIYLKDKKNEKAIYVEKIKEYSSKEMYACFNDVLPGDYELIW